MSCPASRRRRQTHPPPTKGRRPVAPLSVGAVRAEQTDTLDELRPGRDRLELVDVAADALGSGQGEHAGVAKMSESREYLACSWDTVAR